MRALLWLDCWHDETNRSSITKAPKHNARINQCVNVKRSCSCIQQLAHTRRLADSHTCSTPGHAGSHREPGLHNKHNTGNQCQLVFRAQAKAISSHIQPALDNGAKGEKRNVKSKSKIPLKTISLEYPVEHCLCALRSHEKWFLFSFRFLMFFFFWSRHSRSSHFRNCSLMRGSGSGSRHPPHSMRAPLCYTHYDSSSKRTHRKVNFGGSCWLKGLRKLSAESSELRSVHNSSRRRAALGFPILPVLLDGGAALYVWSLALRIATSA